MKKIAIFASGSGSNAQAIAEHFNKGEIARIACICSNSPKAFVLERARNLNIESYVFTRSDFYESDKVINYLDSKEIDFIVLAGFLWLVPSSLIKKYPNRIVNIHPALLPAYGGKGMYGMRVHEAVIANHENESGITIHYVNENYDEGSIILQDSCVITIDDTPETVAQKVHQLEYLHYPVTIEKLVKNL